MLNAFLKEEKDKLAGIEAGAQVNVDDATIKSQYEANTDTNAFTDAEKAKLATINSESIGAGYFDYEESTYCNNAGTWYKVDAVFTPQEEINFTWDGINKRWEYTGQGTEASIFATFSGIHSSSNTRDVGWEFRINGAQLPNPGKNIRVEPGDTMSMSLMVPIVTLATGDYIELYAKISYSGISVKTSDMNILIR